MKLNKSQRVALVIALLAFFVGGATLITTSFSPKAQNSKPTKIQTQKHNKKPQSVKSTNSSKSTSKRVESSSSTQTAATTASSSSTPKYTTTITSSSSSVQSAAAATSASSNQQSVTTTTSANEQITPQLNEKDTEPVNTDKSGFNFGNYHFPIAPFSGNGQVPADNNVYQWTSDSRWFLIEQGGNAGHVIKANVGIGTTVTINNITYHVTDMKSGLINTPNNSQAYDYYKTHINQHGVGFQTCDSVGVLTEWFAD